MVSDPASRLPVPGLNLDPMGPSLQCGLRAGRLHCNTVIVHIKKVFYFIKSEDDRTQFR